MKILQKWWNTIKNWLTLSDESSTPPKKVKTKAKTKKNVKRDDYLNMILEAKKTEDEVGKRRYMSRLANNLTKAITSNDSSAIDIAEKRIRNYLNKRKK